MTPPSGRWPKDRDTARRGFLTVLLSGFLIVPGFSSRPFPSGILQRPPERLRTETVAPGIVHTEIRRGDLSAQAGADRWAIHVLVLDPAKAKLALGRALDQGVGTETPSSIAARHGALAAVNGGYFRTEGIYRGEPAGMLVLRDKVLSEPYRKRSSLAVADRDGRVLMRVSQVTYSAEIVADGGSSHPLAGVNRPRLDDEMVLFTPEFHGTTLTGPGGLEIVVENGRAGVLRDGMGSAAIPAGGFVISAHGSAREWARTHVRAGKKVDVRGRLEMSPPPGFKPDFVLGGGPVLVRSGLPASSTDPGVYGEDFLRGRHPRTAVGRRPDGVVVLVTVDGRQPSLSAGMTVPELESLMIELGCVEAVNMDGGGSTAMVVRGKVVNSPSDPAGERPVGNAILVLLR